MNESKLTKIQQQIDRLETIRTIIMLIFAPSFIVLTSYIIVFLPLNIITIIATFIGLLVVGVGFVFFLFEFFDKKIATIMGKSDINIKGRRALCDKIKEEAGLLCSYTPDMLVFNKQLDFFDFLKVVPIIESQGFEVLDVQNHDKIHIK